MPEVSNYIVRMFQNDKAPSIKIESEKEAKQHELIGDIQLAMDWGISIYQLWDAPDYVIGIIKEYRRCESEGSRKKAEREKTRAKMKSKFKK